MYTHNAYQWIFDLIEIYFVCTLLSQVWIQLQKMDPLCLRWCYTRCCRCHGTWNQMAMQTQWLQKKCYCAEKNILTWTEKQLFCIFAKPPLFTIGSLTVPAPCYTALVTPSINESCYTKACFQSAVGVKNIWYVSMQIFFSFTFCSWKWWLLQNSWKVPLNALFYNNNWTFPEKSTVKVWPQSPRICRPQKLSCKWDLDRRISPGGHSHCQLAPQFRLVEACLARWSHLQTLFLRALWYQKIMEVSSTSLDASTTLHYWLRRPIGFWQVKTECQSMFLFFIHETQKKEKYCNVRDQNYPDFVSTLMPKIKMTGGTPEVRSDKSLILLTFNNWHATNGPMNQRTIGPMD